VKLRFITSIGFLVGLIAGTSFPRTGGLQFLGDQDQPPSGPIRVTTKLITVSVIVRDKHGYPVTGLNKQDFVLLDEKKPQPIQAFSMEKAEVLASPERTLPSDTYSNEIGREEMPSNLTIILLDSLNTDFSSRAYPHSQIRKLLLTLHPQDRVALYALDPGLRVLHDFTSDVSTLLAALERIEDRALQDVDVPASDLSNSLAWRVAALASKEEVTHREQVTRNRTNATAEALRTIADHVSYLPGRKNLIWISADFPFYFEFSNLQRTPDGKKILYPTDTEMVARALSNARIAVYPIDAQGLLPGGADEMVSKTVDKQHAEMIKASNMEALARRTGGRAYRDTNGIARSIRQTIDGSRVSYQLSFYPDNVTWDGSFHKLQVKVNRRDLHVEARDGYFALAEPNLTHDMVRGMIAHAAHSQIDPNGIRFTLHVAPAASVADNKLNLSLSLDPSQFAFASQNGELTDAVDIAFITMDANDHILQTTVLPLPFKIDSDTYDRLVKVGFSLTREVSIPPGGSELRVIVYDEGNSQIGSVRVPLERYFVKRMG
jgi:VWFA-related protein